MPVSRKCDCFGCILYPIQFMATIFGAGMRIVCPYQKNSFRRSARKGYQIGILILLWLNAIYYFGLILFPGYLPCRKLIHLFGNDAMITNVFFLDLYVNAAINCAISIFYKGGRFCPSLRKENDEEVFFVVRMQRFLLFLGTCCFVPLAIGFTLLVSIFGYSALKESGEWPAAFCTILFSVSCIYLLGFIIFGIPIGLIAFLLIKNKFDLLTEEIHISNIGKESLRPFLYSVYRRYTGYTELIEEFNDSCRIMVCNVYGFGISTCCIALYILVFKVEELVLFAFFLIAFVVAFLFTIITALIAAELWLSSRRPMKELHKYFSTTWDAIDNLLMTNVQKRYTGPAIGVALLDFVVKRNIAIK
ncbi:uncharacterized protein LOC111616826, partial [Centruroides sculpturatus]|uniref:uncharacterized protein LOC111616826 n=1 Tax=Centruroides sculpturatus TaxID=218467 RepID=UPI000C6CA86D